MEERCALSCEHPSLLSVQPAWESSRNGSQAEIIFAVPFPSALVCACQAFEPLAHPPFIHSGSGKANTCLVASPSWHLGVIDSKPASSKELPSKVPSVWTKG